MKLRHRKLGNVVHSFWCYGRSRTGGSLWRSPCQLELRGKSFSGAECTEKLTCMGCIAADDGRD